MERATSTGNSPSTFNGQGTHPALGDRAIPAHDVAPEHRTPQHQGPELQALSIELFHTQKVGTPESVHDKVLSLNRVDQTRQAVEQLLHRANLIMGEHSYVHFSLQDGRAVHLSKTDDGVIVHAVSPGILPKEVRYTDIEQRTFLNLKPENVYTVMIEKGSLERTDVILNDLEIFLNERALKPLVVQVSPQGYHENDIHKLKLGLKDTGGQDKYINDSGIALTRLGYNVLNVNRSGPNHPTNGDVRRGMHYSHTGMDLLFVDDALTDSRHSEFIMKEDMYPHGEWQGTPPADPIFFGMACSLANHLAKEPQRRDFVLIGHYADGGTTAWHTAQIIKQKLQENPELAQEGYTVPKVWYNAHSLGVLKQRALEGANEEYDPAVLRFEDRHRFEQFLYDNVDGVLSTSDTMTQSMENDFGRPIDHFLPPGVDTNQFHPRASHVSRTSERYRETWDLLGKLSQQPFEVLSKATLIMEVSRTAETKGKDDVLQAFAANLTDADKQNNSKFLIINIADPNQPNMKPLEKQLAERLHQLVKDLGIEKWVITQNDFRPTMVAQLHQIADIFITGAISEPWGMSLQQAAASKQPVISTTRVPSGTQVLMNEVREVPVSIGGKSGTMLMADGAIFTEPNDYIAMASAMQHILDNPAEARAMAQRAYDLVIPHYTWSNQIVGFIESERGIGHEIGPDGKVVWPSSKALPNGNLTKPRYV